MMETIELVIPLSRFPNPKTDSIHLFSHISFNSSDALDAFISNTCMSGFEVDFVPQAIDLSKTVLDIPWSLGCLFSNHCSLRVQGHYENIICGIQSKGSQILNEKHSRRTGMLFPKYMDLP